MRSWVVAKLLIFATTKDAVGWLTSGRLVWLMVGEKRMERIGGKGRGTGGLVWVSGLEAVKKSDDEWARTERALSSSSCYGNDPCIHRSKTVYIVHLVLLRGLDGQHEKHSDQKGDFLHVFLHSCLWDPSFQCLHASWLVTCDSLPVAKLVTDFVWQWNPQYRTCGDRTAHASVRPWA